MSIESETNQVCYNNYYHVFRTFCLETIHLVAFLNCQLLLKIMGFNILRVKQLFYEKPIKVENN